MISITKSAVPEVLKTAPTPTSVADIKGKEWYKHPDVKKQLLRDQYNKCAYCERKRGGDYGAVEHYRPKAHYQQKKHDHVKNTTGYYWLTNVWENLLYSCTECNSTCKRNLFPLADPARRNTASCDISQEEPMLINPASDHPEAIIGFRQEFAVPVQSQGLMFEKANTTIEVLQLNKRKDLLEQRRRHVESFRLLCAIRDELIQYNCTKSLIEKTQAEINKFKSPDAEFLGVIINQIP